LAEALTKVGLLGIKVWICRGEVYGKRDLAPSFQKEFTRKGGDGSQNDRSDKPFKKRRGDRDFRDRDRGDRGDRRDRRDRDRNKTNR